MKAIKFIINAFYATGGFIIFLIDRILLFIQFWKECPSIKDYTNPDYKYLMEEGAMRIIYVAALTLFAWIVKLNIEAIQLIF